MKMYNNPEDRMLIASSNFSALLYVFVFFYIKEMDPMKGAQDIIRCDMSGKNLQRKSTAVRVTLTSAALVLQGIWHWINLRNTI